MGFGEDGGEEKGGVRLEAKMGLIWEGDKSKCGAEDGVRDCGLINNHLKVEGVVNLWEAFSCQDKSLHVWNVNHGVDYSLLSLSRASLAHVL